jgi:hypothetical protein
MIVYTLVHSRQHLPIPLSLHTAKLACMCISCAQFHVGIMGCCTIVSWSPRHDPLAVCTANMPCRLGTPGADEAACGAALGQLIQVSCALRERSPLLWPPEVAVKLGQVLAAGKGIGPQWAAAATTTGPTVV